MDEPLIIWPREPSDEPAAARHARQMRRGMQRRLMTLLVVAGLAFAVTTWLLVRVEDPRSLLPFAPGPSSVVHAHLQALNRGELRAAYELFSPRYRQQVRFETYQELVVSHWPMFRTRELASRSREESRDRAVLETHLLAADGQQYLARFTLVHSDGRWWIDNIRWGIEPERRRLVAV